MTLKHFALAFALSWGGLASAQPEDTAAGSGTSVTTDTPDAAPTPSGTAPTVANTGGEWHFTVSPYLWFPGVHGNVGAFNRDVHVRVSPGELLSHFRFGLMGAVEARRGPLVIPLDMIWARFADDKAVPRPDLRATTANVKLHEFILTPKVGVRVFDLEKIKFDVLAGARYWHFGENLKFSPSVLGLNFTRAQNLVDPVVGARIQAALAQKFVVNILGDVGGWGTGSTLEYQVAGFLGYRVSEDLILQAGYRYLDLQYFRGGTRPAVLDIAMSGVTFGVTINLK